MPDFLKQHYGTTEGPLGFPQTDRQAQALDGVLKQLPKDSTFNYRKLSVEKAPTELSPGERADVSWISTEEVDRAREVVIARGLDDSHFALNPVVTLQHSYGQPPVGKSLWRKRIKGPQAGVKAKTFYPAKPENWPVTSEWRPDTAFALVQAGLLNGKSIGFIPLQVHEPTAQEREKNGWGAVDLIIDRWLLLEYACVVLPCNQACVTEEVGKSLPAEVAQLLNFKAFVPPAEKAPTFCRLEEVERAVLNHFKTLDPRRIVRDALDRVQGRV